MTDTATIWEWRLHAACRHIDPEVFFHPEGERGPQKESRDRAARAVCATCPVMSACRRHALTVGEPYGVWGGLTVEDRDHLADRARLAAAYVATGPDPIGPSLLGVDRELDPARAGR